MAISEGTLAIGNTVMLPNGSTNNSLSEVANRFVYSTDEKVIGTWIDGKPLYQKTVDCGSVPSNAESEINHNISNISKIINVDGYFSDGNNFIPIQYYNMRANFGVYSFATASKIKIGTNSTAFTSYNAYVTLQYTKSTD